MSDIIVITDDLGNVVFVTNERMITAFVLQAVFEYQYGQPAKANPFVRLSVTSADAGLPVLRIL